MNLFTKYFAPLEVTETFICLVDDDVGIRYLDRLPRGGNMKMGKSNPQHGPEQNSHQQLKELARRLHDVSCNQCGILGSGGYCEFGEEDSGMLWLTRAQAFLAEWNTNYPAAHDVITTFEKSLRIGRVL